MDFAAGEAALAPVQRKETVGKASGAGKAPATSTAGKGGDTKGTKTPDIQKPEVAALDKNQTIKLSKDLGKAKSIQQANNTIGNFLAHLAPSPGTSMKGDIKIEVFIEGVYVSLGYDVSLEHTKYGMELKGKLSTAVGVGVGAGAGLVGGKAFAAVQGTMGFKSKGDSVGECLDLVMLGLDQWLRNQELTWQDIALNPAMMTLRATGGAEWLANAIFGAGFSAQVIKGMDPKSTGKEADEISFTETLGLDAGVSASAGVGNAKVKGGASGNLRHEEETTLSKDDAGKLKTKNKSGMAGNFAMNAGVGPVSGKGAGAFFLPNYSAKDAKLDLSLEAGFPQAGTVGHIAKDLWGTYQSAITGGASKVGNKPFEAEFKEAAIYGSKTKALAVLEACGFLTSAIKFSFSMQGKERTFAIEVTRSKAIDTIAGAGVAGVAVSGKVTSGTKILESKWTAKS